MNYILLFFLISSSTFAQNRQYIFKHIDCKVRLNKTDDFINKLTHEELKEKGYKPQSFVNNDKMNIGDLYFHLEYMRDPSKLWKDCIVKVALKKSKNQKVSSSDKALYSKSVKRALPRHTFNGDERCTRALKDAFIHIPYCQKMSVDEKVKGN